VLTPRIEEKASFPIAGLHTTFVSSLSPDSTAEEKLGPLWAGFLGRLDEIRERADGPLVAYMHADEAGERRHPHELHYVAGAPVHAVDELPEGMVAEEVPGGLYAVFTHRGRLGRLVATIRAIYEEWLPDSGYEHAGRADVETYGERFDPESDDSEMEYWISIRPAAHG
jgi:AraC family transcriptional regulator